MSDDDAVEMTIVFLNEGGYLLGLNADVERTVSLLRLQDPFSDPLVTMATWIKEMDTRNPFLDAFKKGLDHLVTPFMLDGATVSVKGLVSSAYRPSDVQHVEGIRPLLKLECTMIVEDAVSPKSVANIMLLTHRGKIPEKDTTLNGKPLPETAPTRKRLLLSSDTIRSRRHRILEQNFPITLARFRNSKYCQVLCNKLAKMDLRTWQVEQAVCNLVLGKEISPQQPHYGSFSAGKFGQKIAEAVRNRFEIADASDDLKWITQEEITKQVRLDIAALLGALDSPSKGHDLKVLLAELAEKGLLEDATTA